MKTLIKLALLIIVAILGYNYFYGDAREQDQAEEIVEKVKDLGADIKALVFSEKEKYDEGKYDGTIDKFSDLISSLKDKISNIDFKGLEEKQAELKKKIEKLKEKSGTAEEAQKEKVEKEMEELFQSLEEVLKDIKVEVKK